MRDAKPHDGEMDPLGTSDLAQRAGEPVRAVHRRGGLFARQVRELVDVPACHHEQVPEVVRAAGLPGRDVERGDQLVVDDEPARKVDPARELLTDEAIHAREGSLVAPLERTMLFAGYARIAFDVPAR
jgi:hypothetical protein